MSELYPYPCASVKEHPSCVQQTGVDFGSQARITCEPRVANGLDTLKLSLWVDWSNSSFLDRLEAVKAKVQDGEAESLPVDLAGHQWNCMRTGTSRYNYRLIRGDVRVLFNRRNAGGAVPNVRLEIGSISCWSPGYQSIYQDFLSMLELFGGGIVKERVSEAHLAADLIAVPLSAFPLEKREHWITRPHKFSIHYDRVPLTGISWGQGDLMLRVYDKVLELTKSTHKQEAFADIWGVSSFDAHPVTRVEFQVRRSILREFQPIINTLSDLQEHLGAIWKYCTGEWCRLAESAVDRNHHQSRATTHIFWQFVQNVQWIGKSIAVRAKRYLLKDFQKIQQQATGLCMSISAMLGRDADDLEGIIAGSQSCVESNLRRLYRDKNDFVSRMQRKKNAAIGPFAGEQFAVAV